MLSDEKYEKRPGKEMGAVSKLRLISKVKAATAKMPPDLINVCGGLTRECR